MYKLIIVDDELLVRLGIKSFIESGSRDFEVIGTFASGKEAYDFCTSIKPDIVLTDIMMPEMDGLQLIEKLKDLYPEIRIIVLSCHEDYKYVKSAFKLGVNDYVLKHEIEMEDLIKILKNLGKDIFDKNPQNKVFQEKEEIRAEKDSLIRAILNWEEKQPYPEAIDEKINKYRIRLFPSNIVVICISIDNEYDSEYVRIEKHLDAYLIINTINEIFNKHNIGEIICKNNEEFVGILCFEKTNSEKSIHEKLFTVIVEIKESLKKFFNYSTTIGISKKYSSLRDIKKAYAEANEVLLMSFYKEKGTSVIYDENSKLKDKYHNHNIKSIKEVILDRTDYSFNSTEILKFMEIYFDEAINNNSMAPDVVKKDINEMVYIISNYLYEYSGLGMEDIFGPNFIIYRQIEQINNVYILRKWILYFVEKIEKKMQERSKIIPLITKIKEYIDNHYHEDISLKSISEMFHINMNYFCQYFKKELGKNYIDYLTELRVEKAKILLKYDSPSAAEVAEKVGFKNVNYFIRVFKKVTGLNISEYKKA